MRSLMKSSLLPRQNPRTSAAVDGISRVLAFGGNTLAHADGKAVEIMRDAPGAQEPAEFDREFNVDWLDVAPDGVSVLIWSRNARQLWRWRGTIRFPLDK